MPERTNCCLYDGAMEVSMVVGRNDQGVLWTSCSLWNTKEPGQWMWKVASGCHLCVCTQTQGL